MRAAELSGEMGTDRGPRGGMWGDIVAGCWVDAVTATFAGVKAEAERRAGLTTPTP